jgi:hypothetical protein
MTSLTLIKNFQECVSKCTLFNMISYFKLELSLGGGGLWCLTPLSTTFQLYQIIIGVSFNMQLYYKDKHIKTLYVYLATDM